MKISKAAVRKILVISLSNIGDIILTFPVIDILKHDFPDAKISVVIGPKGEGLLKDNPIFERVYIYHKRQPVGKTLAWMGELRREQFDLVVDLRNTAIPFFIGPRYRTSFFLRRDKLQHMRHQHLNRLKSVYPFGSIPQKRYALFVSKEDEAYIDGIIRKEGPGVRSTKFVVVSPGAADEKKRWTEEGFAQVCDSLAGEGANILFIGDANDKPGITRIMAVMKHKAADLSGRASLTQVAHLISRCELVITNDSAPLHLASYLDVPVVALFGPTSPERYGPWNARGVFIKKQADGIEDKEYMKLITPDEVLDIIHREQKILTNENL